MSVIRRAREQRADVEEAVAKLGYWTWDTKDFIEALKRIRDHNALLEPDKHVRIYGIDLQYRVNAAREVLSRASEYGWSDEQRLAVQSIVEAQSEMEPVPRSAEALEALEVAVATERQRADVTGALVARGLALQLQLSALERESDAGAFRDRAMATMVEEASTMISTSPAIVWAHNGHVATDGLEPYRPMGSHLRESLGAGYWAMGLFAYQGKARAWDPKGAIGVIEHELEPAPAYSLEAAVIGDKQAAYVDLRQVDEPTRAWLANAPRYVREFGAHYPSATYEWNLRFVDRSYDGVLVIREVRGTTPTPTGERRATP